MQRHQDYHEKYPQIITKSIDTQFKEEKTKVVVKAKEHSKNEKKVVAAMSNGKLKEILKSLFQDKPHEVRVKRPAEGKCEEIRALETEKIMVKTKYSLEKKLR